MTTPRSSRIGLWLIVFAVLAMGIVGATTVGVWKLATKHDAVAESREERPPKPRVPPADDPAQRRAVLDGAKDAIGKVLTYEAQTIEADIAAAAKLTTGEFRSYYEDFTKQVVIPAARDKGVSSKADVVGIGLVSLDDEHAVVLAYVNQSTTSRAEPEPKQTASAVRVALLEEDDAWLIDKFDPV